MTKFREIGFSLPECHNLKEKIIARFYSFRVKSCSAKSSRPKKNFSYASKSVAMHVNTK